MRTKISRASERCFLDWNRRLQLKYGHWIACHHNNWGVIIFTVVRLLRFFAGPQTKTHGRPTAKRRNGSRNASPDQPTDFAVGRKSGTFALWTVQVALLHGVVAEWWTTKSKGKSRLEYFWLGFYCDEKFMTVVYLPFLVNIFIYACGSLQKSDC